MTNDRTFYCPRCGCRIAAMPGQAIGCPRCGQLVSARWVAGPLPSPAVAAATSFSAPPAVVRRGGTPGIVVVLLLYFFFPVGLYLLWTHPVWTDGQKWKYTAIWLTIICGLFLVGLLASHTIQS